MAKTEKTPLAFSSSSHSIQNEELRKLLKPNPSHEEIILLLQSRYDLYDLSKTTLINDSETEYNLEAKHAVTVNVENLPSYDDANFVITLRNEKNVENFYLLKIHNGVESQQYHECSTSTSSIHLQISIQNFLSHPSSPISTNFPVQTKKGSFTCSYTLGVHSRAYSPFLLVIRLMKYIPGYTLSSCINRSFQSYLQTIYLLIQVGKYAGQTTLQLDKFTQSDKTGMSAGQKRNHAWDVRHTDQLLPFLSYFLNDYQIRLLINVITTFQENILNPIYSITRSYRMGLIHGDANTDNFLCTSQGTILGILDFGDAVWTYKVCEVSIVMAYAMMTPYALNLENQDQTRYISSAAAILYGFHQYYPLLPTERKTLYIFVAVRVVCSIVWGTYSYFQNRENEYVQKNLKNAWRVLEFLWAETPQKKQRQRAIENFWEITCTSKFSNDCKIFDTNDSLIVAQYGILPESLASSVE